MQVKAVSALARDDIVFADALKDVFQNDANVLLFAVNKVSFFSYYLIIKIKTTKKMEY